MTLGVRARADNFIETIAVNVSILRRPRCSAKAGRIKRRAAHYAVSSRLILHHEEMRSAFPLFVVNCDDHLISILVFIDHAHIAYLISMRNRSDEMTRNVNREQIGRASC